MKFKKIVPSTPSQRNLIRLNNAEISNSYSLKQKIKGHKLKSGRNCTGKITTRRKGGGNKQRYRDILFNRNFDSLNIVTSIEYDPFRSANIAAIYDYVKKKYYYILASSFLKVGDRVNSGSYAVPRNGHSLPISKIPVGTLIHNVSPKKSRSSQISRSAGCFSQIIEKTTTTARIQLSSGENRYLSVDCLATVGLVSNEGWFLTTLGKAGRSRWLNRRPKVRGVAMNPVDHPHGGGEGKTSGGRSSVTPWGKPTKNKKTTRSVNKLIIRNLKSK